jgi:hypothetical protein
LYQANTIALTIGHSGKGIGYVYANPFSSGDNAADTLFGAGFKNIILGETGNKLDSLHLQNFSDGSSTFHRFYPPLIL